MIGVTFEPTFEGWRDAAKSAIAQKRPPESLRWNIGGLTEDLFAPAEETLVVGPAPNLSLPREFVAAARDVAHHRDDARWALLYRMLWRIVHENSRLLEVAPDDDVLKFRALEKNVRRDIHKMKAFVRFREVDDGKAFVAWHEPDHLVVPLVAPFFSRRFAAMNWTLLTPDATASWDGRQVSYGPGAERSAAPTGDGLEELWRSYYRATFNPARVKVKAMKREMPTRFWKNLPETTVIHDLLGAHDARVREMIETRPVSAADFMPEARTLPAMRDAVAGCRGCTLYRDANHAVWGEGPLDAKLVFVGEQPGDEEDRAGRPFIGPAGRLLDDMLAQAGIDRARSYLTNAVKHFRWRPQGTRRLHQRARPSEVAACQPWLIEELKQLQPHTVVCLGVTAAISLLGKISRLEDVRGRFHRTPWCDRTLVTIHPSYLLRLPDPEVRARETARFLAELRLAS